MAEADGDAPPASQAPRLPQADDEVGELISVLHRSVQRLEALTAGEVDAVAGPGGQPFLLAGAQAHARQREASRRADILDALPAHVAMLDPRGRILVVNAAWRRFGNAVEAPLVDDGVGQNYVDVCARARGPEAAQAHAVAAGLRAVLTGTAATFSMEYPCHSPEEERWFLLTATPLAADDPMGAIVMHVDVTALRQAKNELQESRQRLAGVIESAMDAVISIDEDQCIVLCNPAAERMFGHRADDLQGQPLDFLLPERLRADHAGHIAAFGDTGVTPRRMGALAPVIGRRSNGEEFPLEASISRHRSVGRWVFTAILRDITERRRAEQRIARQNRLYAMLSGINMLIVRARNRAELFEEACRIAVEAGDFKVAAVGEIDPATRARRIVAWRGGEPGDRAARDGTLAADRPEHRALQGGAPVICNDIVNDPALAPCRAALLARGHRALAAFPLSADGAPDAVLSLYAAEAGVFDAEEIRLLEELASDLSYALDHFANRARLDHLAFYDALTGLANHGLFLERVAQQLRGAAAAGQRVAVVVLDLDRFRHINDSVGRPAGDTLLKQVADWLRCRLGDADVLCRFGGDRFAMLLPQAGADGDLAQQIEGLLTSFSSHPFCLDDAVFRISAKAGVARFPEDGDRADLVCRNAEIALKAAKAGGDRLLFYAGDMTTSVAGHLSLENQMRLALEREEFVLHYQPKINLHGSRRVAAEALIRWNDPRTGLVPPGHFIPILEQTGLIHEVGRWALAEAIAERRRWAAMGLADVRIAVNVSPLQLRQRGFVGEIERALGSDGRAAAGLELEITESVLMEDVPHSIATLKAVRALGVHVAIDDFGTGFSSLSYLARLPVDTLKIDRSFIVEMGAGPQGLALVSTIIGLAHALTLNVVAEGVETDEQSRLLRLLSCDEMQGFLFSRPVPAAEFEARFLREAPGTALH